jgi:hypothetical protein
VKKIVVCDPSGEVREGHVIEGPNNIGRLERRRVVMLPYEPGFEREAVGGYFRRSWGEGWLFDRMAGERGCPMLLHVSPKVPFVYWCARLELDGESPRGNVKLTTDSSQRQAMSGGLGAELRATALDRLGLPDPDGGWTIGGRSRLGISLGGYLALSLYVVARRARVIYSAVSQCREEADVFARPE